MPLSRCSALFVLTVGGVVLAAPSGASAATEVTFGNDLRYTPDPTTIKTGEAVTFRGDFARHPFSSTAGAFADRDRGDAYKVRFDRPGTYTYYCRVHSDGKSGMVARLVVEGSGDAKAAPAAVVTPSRFGLRARTLRVASTGSGVARATLRSGPITLGTGRVRFRRAGTGKLKISFTTETRRRLESNATTRAQLSVRIARRGAAAQVYTRPVTLRR